eukprot:2439504-Rhodomonas_salina.2
MRKRKRKRKMRKKKKRKRTKRKRKKRKRKTRERTNTESRSTRKREQGQARSEPAAPHSKRAGRVHGGGFQCTHLPDPCIRISIACVRESVKLHTRVWCYGTMVDGATGCAALR